MTTGNWLVIEELLERADPSFLEELRKFDDADRLGAFAPSWLKDKRPGSRRFLLQYLLLPLNAFHHEPLVKRLYKAAESVGDDEVMAHFLVLFDRSLRRRRRKGNRTEWRQFDKRADAEALVRQWAAEGADSTNLHEWGQRFTAFASWSEEAVVMPRGTTLPRGKKVSSRFSGVERLDFSDVLRRIRWQGKPPTNLRDLPEKYAQRLAKLRLFTVHTRHYLRRRAWRYFRKLGKQHPDRYLTAASTALKLYQDADVADGLALLDNWGLLHILFHDSPVLVAKTNGWMLAPERKLSELTPAPIYADVWKKAPAALVGLMKDAKCRPVRQWAIRFLGQDGGDVLASLPLEDLFALLGHADEEVVAIAAAAIRRAPEVEALPAERWLALLETPNPAVLEILCELMAQKLSPERISLEQALRLASARPTPLAQMALGWLRTRKPESQAECHAVLALAEAQADSVRPEFVRWAREVLSASPYFEPAWVLEFLDSRHGDVRAEGWAWLQAEPRARDDVDLWRKLLESPYDDVRLGLVADLEKRLAEQKPDFAERAALDPSLLRLLWASVLLNIHRGGRTKPVALRQIVRRLTTRPADATDLLPVLAVALRSMRGPEWRAGLAAVVQLVERNSQLEPAVRQAFPELRLVVS